MGDNKRELLVNLQDLTKSGNNWKIIQYTNQLFIPTHEQLMAQYSFTSDKDTYDFINQILIVAEEMNHHPTLIAEWHKVTLFWSTHDKKSISDLDIIMARKSDDIYQIHSKKDK